MMMPINLTPGIMYKCKHNIFLTWRCLSTSSIQTLSIFITLATTGAAVFTFWSISVILTPFNTIPRCFITFIICTASWTTLVTCVPIESRCTSTAVSCCFDTFISCTVTWTRIFTCISPVPTVTITVTCVSITTVITVIRAIWFTFVTIVTKFTCITNTSVLITTSIASWRTWGSASRPFVSN